MKKMKKVYGVRGKVEWRVSIPAGGARLTVTFTGGGANVSEGVPARYSTESFIEQQVIERSELFKKGVIRLLRGVETGGEVELAGKGAGVSSAPAEPVQKVRARAGDGKSLLG